NPSRDTFDGWRSAPAWRSAPPSGEEKVARMDHGGVAESHDLVRRAVVHLPMGDVDLGESRARREAGEQEQVAGAGTGPIEVHHPAANPLAGTEQEGVVAAAAGEDVGAEPAGDPVVAGIAAEHVVEPGPDEILDVHQDVALRIA